MSAFLLCALPFEWQPLLQLSSQLCHLQEEKRQLRWMNLEKYKDKTNKIEKKNRPRSNNILPINARGAFGSLSAQWLLSFFKVCFLAQASSRTVAWQICLPPLHVPSLLQFEPSSRVSIYRLGYKTNSKANKIRSLNIIILQPSADVLF